MKLTSKSLPFNFFKFVHSNFKYTLVTTPPVNGDRNPITRMIAGTNRPMRCFRSLPNAMEDATK